MESLSLGQAMHPSAPVTLLRQKLPLLLTVLEAGVGVKGRRWGSGEDTEVCLLLCSRPVLTGAPLLLPPQDPSLGPNLRPWQQGWAVTQAPQERRRAAHAAPRPPGCPQLGPAQDASPTAHGQDATAEWTQPQVGAAWENFQASPGASCGERRWLRGHPVLPGRRSPPQLPPIAVLPSSEMAAAVTVTGGSLWAGPTLQPTSSLQGLAEGLAHSRLQRAQPAGLQGSRAGAVAEPAAAVNPSLGRLGLACQGGFGSCLQPRGCPATQCYPGSGTALSHVTSHHSGCFPGRPAIHTCPHPPH